MLTASGGLHAPLMVCMLKAYRLLMLTCLCFNLLTLNKADRFLTSSHHIYTLTLTCFLYLYLLQLMLARLLLLIGLQAYIFHVYILIMLTGWQV